MCVGDIHRAYINECGGTETSHTMLSPTSLPKNPYNVLDEKRWHDAYEQCLQTQPPDTDATGSTDTEKNLVYARILGYLILEAPTPTGLRLRLPGNP